MQVVVIIQARMSSTRLPGKIMLKILNKSLLEYQLERVNRANNITKIAVATTVKGCEQPIVSLCNRLSIPVFRGPEEDVLSRYYQAAKEFAADVIVRITSDCPLIDPKVIDLVVHKFLSEDNKMDYVSNTLLRTYPRGMDTEVFSFNVLEEAYLNAKKDYQREHVTPYIFENHHKYRLKNVSYREDLSRHRWTVDTIEDFELVSKIIRHIYQTNPSFSLEDILKLLEVYPKWMEINPHIEQKSIKI